MTSTGVNRVTGKVLQGWPHVAQSLKVLFMTRIGSRVMRRTYGSLIPQLLGENATPRTILRFFTAVIVAVELWEPRFRIRKVSIASADNPIDQMRVGRLRFAITGVYRPNGHLGDETADFQEKTLVI